MKARTLAVIAALAAAAGAAHADERDPNLQFILDQIHHVKFTGCDALVRKEFLRTGGDDLRVSTTYEDENWATTPRT